MPQTQYKVKIHHECAPGETECEHLSIFCLKTPPSSITDQETGKELFSRTLVSLIGTQEIKGKKHHIQKEDSSAVNSLALSRVFSSGMVAKKTSLGIAGMAHLRL